MPRQLKITVVRVAWEGPFTYDAVQSRNGPADRGLYQIYMTHPVFGRGALGYIGKTDRQTFATRLKQHWDEWARYESEVTIYLGRIAPEDSGSEEEWERLLGDVERLAIFRHRLIWRRGELDTWQA
jgi:hypothetical protein